METKEYKVTIDKLLLLRFAVQTKWTKLVEKLVEDKPKFKKRYAYLIELKNGKILIGYEKD